MDAKLNEEVHYITTDEELAKKREKIIRKLRFLYKEIL